MKCARAAEIFRGLEQNQLAVEADEIEELLALGLAVEAEPDDLAMLSWLQPVVLEHARCNVDAPNAADDLAATLRLTEEELRSDWYRMKASKPEVEIRERDRITMRRAVALLHDPSVKAAMAKLAALSRQVAPGARWVTCEPLGCEHYALTHKGRRVSQQLAVRLARFGESELKAFLATLDKVDAKMHAFAAEVGFLSQNIGYVRKNREQVVIGLVKTGAPPQQAIGAYRAGLQAAQNQPDVAVTCARNAATAGSPAHAAAKLREAEAALRHAGIPNTPIAMGAAKSLLAFNPPASGAPRFVELCQRLARTFGRSDMNYKYAARLMPASGTPEDLERRVFAAGSLLNQMPNQAHHRRTDVRSVSVALASMVRADDQLPALVARFRQLELALMQAGVSTPTTVEGDALECVACAGTPAEVVDTVAALTAQLCQGRPRTQADVSVAVAFAKRFAF